MVWSSTACSCRAGSSSEKDRCSPPSGLLNRVEASTSGVRQACICHHSVNAAIQNNASETTAMKTDVSNRSPQIPKPPVATGSHTRRVTVQRLGGKCEARELFR